MLLRSLCGVAKWTSNSELNADAFNRYKMTNPHQDGAAKLRFSEG